jgi:hypothetical protein
MYSVLRDRFKTKIICDKLARDCVVSAPLRESGGLKKTFGVKALNSRGLSLLSALQELLKSKITHPGAIVRSIVAIHNIESSTSVEYPAGGIGAKPYQSLGQSFNRCSVPLCLYAHTTLKEVLPFD